MKTQDASPGGAAGGSKNHRSPRHEDGGQAINQFTDLSKRSKVMKSTNNAIHSAMRGAAALFLLIAMTVFVSAQDLKLNSATTVNNGTINVNRNVVNNAPGGVAAVTGTGTVQFTGSGGANTHSVTGGTSVSFYRLDVRGNRITTLAVATAVTDRLRVGYAANTYTAGTTGFSIGTKTLTLGNLSSYSGTAALTLNEVGSKVVYSSGTAQDVLTISGGVTYATLEFSGTGVKTVPANGKVTTATLTQPTGQLVLNEDVDVTGTATIADLGSIANLKTLDVTGTATAASVTSLTNGGTGTFKVSANIGVTIGTLGAGNTGKVDNAGTGTMSFTSNITNGGTITTATGKLDLNGAGAQTNNGTISVTGAGELLINGDIATTPGTLTLDATSTTRYDGTAQNLATGVTYGNLSAEGTDVKSAGADLTVAGNLALGQNILQTAGALKMTSTTATNVSGSAEVIGAVQRQHNFTAAADYSFNRANVTMAFDATADGNITLSMDPATNPTNAAAKFARYVSRNYSISPTSPPGNLTKLQLYYASAGDLVNVVSEAKLGARYTLNNGTTWSKLLGTGAYRSSGSNIVTLSNLSQSLTGVDEFAVAGINFISTNVDVSLSTASNYDENAFPDTDDDVIIRHTGVTVGATPLDVATLTIEADKALTTDNAVGTITVGTSTTIDGSLTLTSGNAIGLAATTIGSAGSVSVASGRTLAASSFTNNSSNPSTFTGNVTFGSLSNTGSGLLTFNGNSSSIGDMTGTGGIEVGGALGLATGASAPVTYSGNITVSGSGVLTVGASGIPSSLIMDGTTRSLTVSSSADPGLMVYGDLDIGANVTLSNSGTITVGE